VKQKATTQSNSLFLHHHNTDRVVSTGSPSDSSNTTQAISFPQVSDTADAISTKLSDAAAHPRESQVVNREAQQMSVAMPFWLITRERRNELEFLPSMHREPTGTPRSVEFSMQGVTTGSVDFPDLMQLLPTSPDVHTPCLRLSIGPASTASTASSCLSPHPSLEYKKPRCSSVEREALASTSRQGSSGVFTKLLDRSAHSSAIGIDLALSIPEPGNQMEGPGTVQADRSTTLSDFLGQANWFRSCNAGLYQSMEKHHRNSTSTENYSPCSGR